MRWRGSARARAASALNHSGICTIYEIGDDDGRPYLVMELLEGESLQECVAKGSMELNTLLGVFIEVADALDRGRTLKGLSTATSSRRIFS